MADLSITELPALAEADISAADLLAVADVSASETKRISTGDFITAALARFTTDGTIPGAKIATDSITASQIAAGAIGVSELAGLSVSTAAIQDGAITTAKLATGAVTATAIATNAVGADEIADNAVDTAAIADFAVTTSKLADLNVTTAKINTGAVTNDKIADTTIAYAKLNLADGSVPGAKLVSNSITGAQIAANAITSSELADNAVDSAALQDNAVTSAKLATDSVTSAAIASGAVGTAELADASVTAAKLAPGALAGATLGAGSITSTELADAAVVTAKLADNAVTTAKLANASITAAKLAPASVTADAIATDAVGADELADAAVDTAAVADGAITNTKLAAGSVTAAKLGAGAVGTSAIADAAVTAAKLGTGAVGTAALADAAITGSKIAGATITAANLNLGLGSISGDVITIGSLNGLAISTGSITASQLGAASVTTETLANGAVTSSKVANGAIETAAIADAAITNIKVADLTIAYGKLNINDGEIPAAKLANDSITALQVAPNAIGASELAAGAVDTAAVQDLAITDAKIATGLSGAKISDLSLPGAALIADTITGDKIAPSAVDRGLDLVGDAIGHTNAITPGTANGITFDEQGHITGTGAIAAADLPAATVGTRGAVSIPTESGLTVSGAGVVAHADTIVPGTANGITYNSTGHITSTAPLSGSDLPLATTTTVGGVIVGGPTLSVDGAGTISHVASPITPGTYTRLTIDARGHATAGTALQASDVPELDTSKITSGTFGTALIADDAITGDKLANYSTAQFGEVLPAADFIGQFFFNPLDKNIYLWDGNVWQPVGVSLGELIFAGTYNASTNEVASATTTGAAVGLTVGDPLPAASSTLTSYYVVVSVGGTGTAPAPAETLAPPDIILCDGSAWVQIDVSSTYTSQTAANVGFTPAGTIASSNVQAALEEVASEAANAANLSSGVVAVARGGTGLSSYTKGDLLAATGTTALGSLAVGTNGQVLTADSSTATGLAWTSAAPGTVTSVTGTGAITVVNTTTTPNISVASASTSLAGVVQLSDSINTTSSTLAATSTAVKAAYDLANAALSRSGGTVTGNINLDAGVVLVFEGSTADDFELTLTAANPTADRTITLPNVSGTLITTGDTATVTNTMLVGSIADSKLNTISTANKITVSAIDIDGATDIGAALSDADLFVVDDGGAGTNRKAAASRITDYAFGKVSGDITISSTGTAAIGSGVIVNADISASAAIADTKLATISTAGKVSGTAITSGNISTSGSFATTSTMAIGQSSAAANTDLDLAGTYAQTVVAVGALNIDCSTGNYFTKTINANSTFTVSNVPASRAYSFTLELTHTSGTITWFSGVEWPGGTAPTLTTGKTHLFMFITDNGGTRWRAAALVDYTN